MKEDCVALLTILDGFNTKWLNQAAMPNIKEILETGCGTLRCKSVYPSVTYTAHCSLLTGEYPSVHGIVGNCFYEKKAQRSINFDVDDVNEYLQTSTIFEKINGITAAIGEPITRGADIVISKSKVQEKPLWKQDEYCTEEAIRIMENNSPQLLLINFTSIDRIAEKYGPFSKEVMKAVENADRLIGTLKTHLNRNYKDYLLLVTADHGMTTVNSNINLSEILGGVEANIFPSHRFAHIYLNHDEVSDVRNILESDERIELILTLEESRKINLFNQRTGHLIVSAEKGYELTDERLKGSHGGITDDEMYVPLIINKPEYHDVLENATILDVQMIIFRYFNEKEAEKLVKNKLKDSDPAHNWNHVKRVLRRATDLAMTQRARIEMVRMSCIFHDVERKEVENHAKRGAELAEKFLKQKGYSEDFIRGVKESILQHHEKPEELKTVEAKILWDADKLDALGLIGLIRCLKEAEFEKKSLEDAILHFERDNEQFKFAMHFDETQKTAFEEVQIVEELLKKIKKEYT